MEYKKIDDTFVVRIYKGEDIVEQLEMLAIKENIKAAAFTGLGAGNYIEIGIFDMKEKKYNTKVYEGMYEITNLTGNISIKDDKPYLHMHINFSDDTNNVYGGHMLKCEIAVTAEIFVTVLSGVIERKFDSAVGGFMLDLK